MIPTPDNSRDLGASSLEWRNLFLDGTAHIDTLDVDANAGIVGNLTVTGTSTLTGNASLNGGASTNGKDFYSDNGAFISNDSNGDFAARTGSNIDHIWHNESDNAWNFVSDAAYKSAGNSKIKAGSFYGNGANISSINANNISSDGPF